MTEICNCKSEVDSVYGVQYRAFEVGRVQIAKALLCRSLIRETVIYNEGSPILCSLFLVFTKPANPLIKMSSQILGPSVKRSFEIRDTKILVASSECSVDRKFNLIFFKLSNKLIFLSASTIKSNYAIVFHTSKKTPIIKPR